jgi:hypothetical protein
LKSVKQQGATQSRLREALFTADSRRLNGIVVVGNGFRIAEGAGQVKWDIILVGGDASVADVRQFVDSHAPGLADALVSEAGLIDEPGFAFSMYPIAVDIAIDVPGREAGGQQQRDLHAALARRWPTMYYTTDGGFKTCYEVADG